MQIDLKEDRYARQTLITWWDQSALLKSKVLVVGAGALGNEIVKNLALVGVGNISIVDMDHIEMCFLS
jgi:adenylyltransferase/sulfurtransferase